MAHRLSVLLGPASAGKTIRLVADYADRLAKDAASGLFGRSWWIAPNRFAVENVRQLLLLRHPQGCIAPQVDTFDGFAERILRLAANPTVPIARCAQRWILRKIIERLRERGDLRLLKHAAGSVGFLDLVAGQVAEFKRLEIWPQELERASSRSSADPGTRSEGRQGDGTSPDFPGARSTAGSVADGFEFVKGGVLASIYAAYQDVLNQHHLYDAEGRFWSARTQLVENDRSVLRSIELVVVDGFTDFTRPQLEMLEVIAAEVKEVILTLPMDGPALERERHELGLTDRGREQVGECGAGRPIRRDLFSKPLATLAQLRRRTSVQVIGAANAPNGATRVSGFLDELFRGPESQAGGDPDADSAGASRPSASLPSKKPIKLWPANNQAHEFQEIARDIKRRLLTGEADAGDMIVVARSLESIAPIVESTFVEYGIPTWVEWRPRLSAAPFVRNLMLLLRLDRDDWKYSDTLALISNNGIRWPTLSGAAANSQAIRIAAEKLLRRAQLPHGREALLGFCRAALESTTATTLDDDKLDVSPSLDFEPLLASWEALARLLDRLPQHATPAQWGAEVDALWALCGCGTPDGTPQDAAEAPPKVETSSSRANVRKTAKIASGRGRTDCEDAKWAAIDQAGRIALHDALRAVHYLDEKLHGRASELSREEFNELLVDLATHERLPSRLPSGADVRVLSAISARSVNARIVYFAGLSEHAMPAPGAAARYYTEAETAQLIEAGLPLASAAGRYDEEMLLFYEVLSRAGDELILSYPALDEKAQPLLPSPFIDEVVRIAPVDIRRLTDLRPVAREGSPLSPREFRTRAVADVFDSGDCKRLSLLGHNTSLEDMGRAVLAGLEIVQLRSRAEDFGPAEGSFVGAAARASLATEFGAEHLWSPTALEDYALCPFRFLASRVLHLEPLEDLELATDYRRRGKIVHDCLAKLYRRMGLLHKKRVLSEQKGVADFVGELAAIIDAFGAEIRTHAHDLPHALFRIDLQQVKELGEKLHEQQSKYDASNRNLDCPPLPAHFEVRFGPTRQAPNDSSEDPLSTDMPFELDLGDERVQITGRIDRIDVGSVGGVTVFNVIDYKTGRAERLTEDRIASGLRLQIPLYALAAEELLLKELGGLAWQADYWWVREDGYGKSSRRSGGPFALRELREGGLEPTQEFAAIKTAMTRRIKLIVQGVRQGDFAVDSADEHCTQYCDFASICRVAQIRALGKSHRDAQDIAVGPEEDDVG